MIRKWRHPLLILAIAAIVTAACSQQGATGYGDAGSGPAPSAAGSEGQQPSATQAPEEPEIENFRTEGFPIVDEPITLKLMGSKAPGHVPWDQMTFFQELTKLTNIRFEFDTPPSEAYEEKLNLAFATGTLPDALFGARLPVDKEVTYGQQGLLIPLEDLIDKYAPNLLQVFEANPGLRESITAPDGHIYSLPRIDVRPDIVNTESHVAYPRMWINAKWLGKVGLPKPATTEELYEVLKAFKEQDPNGNGQADEIPLSAYDMDIRGVVLNWFGFVVTENQLFDVKDGKVRYAPVEPEYKAYLTFMNRLYAGGLLDQESYSQSPQQKTAKGNQEQLGLFYSLAPFQVVGNDLDPDYDLLLPLTSEVNDTPVTSVTPLFSRGTFAITKQNPHPEATMRLVDYLYSDEGSDLGQFGVEGVNWEFNESKTGRVFIGAEGKTSQELRAMATPDAGTAIPRNQSKLAAELATIENEEKAKDSNPPRYHMRSTYSQLFPYAQPTYPMLYFTLEEQKEINVLQADIKTYVEQMEAKFIFGNEPLDRFDSFVDTLKRMEVDRYIQIHQDAYDRWSNH